MLFNVENIETSKSGLVVILKVTGNGAVRKLGYGITRGQSNLTKSASRGEGIPRLGVTPGG